MSRDQPPWPGPYDEPGGDPDRRGSGGPEGSGDHGPDPGHVRPTSVGVLVGFGLAGLVLGWLLRPVGVRLNGTAPLVPWLQVGVLFFVAAVVAGVALLTWRALRRRGERIEPHRAVNRLVLAKSCALVGALVGGGYLGYALSFLGRTGAPLAQQRAVHSLLAGLAGWLVVAGALWLERACRVSPDDDDDLR